MRHLGRKMWRCYYPQNYWVALVGFALVGFALVGFALVGFALVGFALVGFATKTRWA
jgi:hypothetical protein